jgi:hypothetical protein
MDPAQERRKRAAQQKQQRMAALKEAKETLRLQREHDAAVKTLISQITDLLTSDTLSSESLNTLRASRMYFEEVRQIHSSRFN